MKKSFLLMGALCVGAAFVSCVDDSESSEVKELRQVQLDTKKADLDKQYWNFYNDAVAKVKTYQADLKDQQTYLDAAKDNKLTLEAGKAAAVAYQQQVIARNQKDIEDLNAEIEAQKSLSGKTYEEIQEAKRKAANAKEEANKAAADYWIDLTSKGYNKNYDGNAVALGSPVSNKIDMLLKDYSTGVKYNNNKLDELPFVKAMNAIYSNTKIWYEFEGEQQSTNVYEFTNSSLDNYKATEMFKTNTYVLEDANGKQITTYKVYQFNNRALKKAGSETLSYTAALNDFINGLADGSADKAQFNALKGKIGELVTILGDDSNYKAYTDLINEYAEHAKKLYALNAEAAKATAISDAYAAYTVGNNESTIAGLQDKIKTNLTAIDNANKAINETINNGITDDETLIAYYNNLISELKSAIAANQAVADKYRALIAGSESSSNTQQQAPASEETAE